MVGLLKEENENLKMKLVDINKQLQFEQQRY